MNKVTKICYFRYMYKRYSTRIFVKECSSLVNSGFIDTLVVADNKRNEMKKKVKIIDIRNNTKNRLHRITIILFRIKKNANIYHFHNIKLIPIALRQILKNNKVIYDIPEDLPREIVGKPYSLSWLKPLIAKLIVLYEIKV